MPVAGWTAKIRASMRARREAAEAKAVAEEARYRQQSEAAQRAAAAEWATRTIADQIRRHPDDVTALDVTVRSGKVITQDGTWLLRGSRATVTSHSLRQGYGYYGRYQQSGLLAITGPYGEVCEQVLSGQVEVHAARLLAAHVNARAAALKLPRRL
jgi:hypothetical protein